MLAAFFRLLFLVPLGFIAACIGGATMAAVGIFGIDDSRDFLPATIAAVTLMTLWAGAIAALPALLAVALAELFGWRSILYYLFVGGIVGLIADQASKLVVDPAPYGGRTVIMLAAGFVGGFVYWLIAGRLAGQNLSGNLPPATESGSDTSNGNPSGRNETSAGG